MGLHHPMQEVAGGQALLRKTGALGDDAKSLGRLGEELSSRGVFRRVVVALGVSKARELGDGDHRSGASFDGSDVGIVDDHPTAVLGEERRGGCERDAALT